MSLKNSALALSLLSLVFLPLCGVAETLAQISPRGGLSCLRSDIGPASLVRVTEDGGIRAVDFNTAIKRTTRSLKRAKRTLRIAERNFASLSSVAIKTRRVQELNRALYLLRLCAGDPSLAATEYYDSAPCGFTAPILEPESAPSKSRIVNGQNCFDQNSPVVELTMQSLFGSPMGQCSGTVVGPYLIVTAAHCLEGPVADVVVTSGTSRIRSAFFDTHPDFISFGKNYERNDLAVIVTSKPLNLPAVRILRDEELQIGEQALISGYGDDSFGFYGEYRAGYSEIALVTDAALFIEYSGEGEGANTCYGDSGGPLFVWRDSSLAIAGVTSSGIRADCGPGDWSGFSKLSMQSNAAFLGVYLP